MTEISLRREDNLLIFRVEGHAEYVAEGADIVCASCSALAGTLATMIKNLPVPSDIRFESGLTEIRLNVTALNIYRLEIIHALQFVMLGYAILEEQYPGNVIILEWEGRESQSILKRDINRM